MKIPTLTIALLSLIPSIGICIFVYFKDKKEKEPLWLLGALFAVSAALYFPVWYLGNRLIEPLIGKIVGNHGAAGLGGVAWTNSVSENLHKGLCALIAVALIEELVRWLILYFLTNKSRHFNCTFDGVVYSVMVSMGALVVRNVMFSLRDSTVGWNLFLPNLANSFPWYLLFGIIMGVFYSYWHVSKRADRRENKLISEGKLKSDKLKYPVGKLILSIAVPVILHAAYDFAINQRSKFISNAPIIIFYVIAGIMMVVAVLLVIVLSKRDTTERDEIERIIESEHGDLPDEYYEGIEEGEDDLPTSDADVEEDVEEEKPDDEENEEKEEKGDE